MQIASNILFLVQLHIVRCAFNARGIDCGETLRQLYVEIVLQVLQKEPSLFLLQFTNILGNQENAVYIIRNVFSSCVKRDKNNMCGLTCFSWGVTSCSLKLISIQ
jgi:hypothetical protein